MKNVIEINGVRIGKKGIRHGGKYVPVWITRDTLINRGEVITVRCKEIGDRLPRELGNVENNSEPLTDYFEKDRVRFHIGTPNYVALQPLAI